jgi:hypothetical protein
MSDVEFKKNINLSALFMKMENKNNNEKLSNAEKQKLYRERRKLNEEKEEENRRKDRQR